MSNKHPDQESSARDDSTKSRPEKAGSSQPEKKFRVPELKTSRSPEEQLEYERRRRDEIRAKLKFQRNLKVASFLAFVALLGGLFFVLSQEDNLLVKLFKTKDDAKIVEGRESSLDPTRTLRTGGKPASSLSELEVAMRDGDVRSLMRLARLSQDKFLSSPLPQQLAMTHRKKNICKRIEEINEDEVSRKFAISGQLDALILLDTLNEHHQLNDGSIRSELFGLASRCIEMDDLEIRRKSVMGLCLARAHDYANQKDDVAFEAFMDQVAICKRMLQSDATTARGLSKIRELIQQPRNQAHIERYLDEVGTMLKASNDPEVYSVGAFLHDEMLLGNISFEDFSEDVLQGDKEAIRKLELYVDKIVDAKNKVSEIPFSKVLSVCENLSSVGLADQEAKMVAKLRSFRDRVSKEDTLRRIDEILERYDTRKALLGTELDIRGTGLDQSPIQDLIKDRPCVVCFASVLNQTSFDYLQELDGMVDLNSSGVRVIGVCVETNIPKSKKRDLNFRFPNVDFMTRSGLASSLLEQCPVIKAPYVVIIDQNHVVRRINVGRLQLREQLLDVLSGT